MQQLSVRRNVTQLWQIERDGNPLRRYAHVSPFIGKLAPLDNEALQDIARMALQRLKLVSEGDILVIGMTESSLLLGWYVAQQLAGVRPGVDLRFTTRKRRGAIAGRTFHEPHSHGPQHFLSLEAGRSYGQIVIVEDELTTGATLRNLILTLLDVSRRISVVTLSDMRVPLLKKDLASEMAARGVEFDVLDLSRKKTAVSHSQEKQRGGQTEGQRGGQTARVHFNPFGRSETARRGALERLDNVAGHSSGAWYMVGECVDLALCVYQNLIGETNLPGLGPELRQVTRSPWVVDGVYVRTRECFQDGAARQLAPYFLYNWGPPSRPSAVIWCEALTAGIATRLQGWLHGQGVESHLIEVSAA